MGTDVVVGTFALRSNVHQEKRMNGMLDDEINNTTCATYVLFIVQRKVKQEFAMLVHMDQHLPLVIFNIWRAFVSFMINPLRRCCEHWHTT